LHALSYIISPVTRKQAKQGGEIPSPRRDSDFAPQNKEVITGTVIYADVLFGINFVANLCVLLITDWIFKFSARISRMIISATLGAAWAVICVCIPLRFALLEKFITYGPVTLIMSMIMLSGNKNFKLKTSKQLKLYMRNLLKAGAGMILTALFAGGIMHWLKYTFAGYFIENVILSDSELVIFLTVTVIVVVIVLKTLRLSG
jgi:stage II sporulation protein GA (sporulation sigma-E factor processing peptidase)